MVQTKRKMRFPLKVVLLMFTTFLFGSLAGATFYATGQEVISTVRMAMVSHTEYRYSEPGQIIARITDFQGSPVVVNNCTATIKYPDKTAFVTAALMSASTVTGDYYYNFTTPAGPEGVYEYQATCTYASGSKTASVTNSFHLSSAFTSVLGNISAVQTTVNGVAANLTIVQNDLLSINTSLSNQIAQNVSSVLTQLSAVNTSLSNQITNVNTALAGNFTQIQSNFSSVFSQLSGLNASLSNLTVNVNLSGVNVSVDFTPVLNAIASVNATVNQLSTDMAANFTYTNSLITAVNASTQSSFTVINDKLDVMNVTLNANNAYLVLINATTTDTYAYVTGTLATNVNNILTDLGVINATVNRIETMTTAINSTVDAIKTNQENAINMQVFSG